MNSYLLYGFSKGKLENLRKMVESALEITLNPHESIYHGGDYYRLNWSRTFYPSTQSRIGE